MEPTVGKIKALLEEKHLAFQGLSDLLKEERACIEKMDVTGLWKLSSEKEAAASRINGIRLEILGIMDLLSPGHDLVPDRFSAERVIALLGPRDGKEMGALPVFLRLVKEEIASLARENRRYTRDCLGAVEGMIGAMAGEGNDLPSYDRSAAAGSLASGRGYGGASARTGGSGYGATTPAAGSGYGASTPAPAGAYDASAGNGNLGGYGAAGSRSAAGYRASGNRPAPSGGNSRTFDARA